MGVQKENKSPETKLNVMEDCDVNDRIEDCSYEAAQWDTRWLREAVQWAQEENGTKEVLYQQDRNKTHTKRTTF